MQGLCTGFRNGQRQQAALLLAIGIEEVEGAARPVQADGRVGPDVLHLDAIDRQRRGPVAGEMRCSGTDLDGEVAAGKRGREGRTLEGSTTS